MTIRENCSLKDHNTFGMDVKSDRMVDWSTPDELKGILADLERPVLMMGGGSNLLFMSDFKGTVLHSSVTTIDILGITNDHVHVRVGSGVVWDDFVAWCAVNGYWGVENLSAIPGEVGASAVQNIGAYGVATHQSNRSANSSALSGTSARKSSYPHVKFSKEIVSISSGRIATATPQEKQASDICQLSLTNDARPAFQSKYSENRGCARRSAFQQVPFSFDRTFLIFDRGIPFVRVDVPVLSPSMAFLCVFIFPLCLGVSCYFGSR